MADYTLSPSMLPGRDPVTDFEGDRMAVLDSGSCPFCEKSGFEDAHQHARMAHANDYDALTED